MDGYAGAVSLDDSDFTGVQELAAVQTVLLRNDDSNLTYLGLTQKI